jgi:hypothetical protein
VITYRATLDVPAGTLRAVTAWLRENRSSFELSVSERGIISYEFPDAS